MTADRRQITLMSCDMVGSTMYASSLDPEDLEILMTTYFEACKKCIADNRGTLAHHTGDGFLAYFGYPRTLGRNAQEAIECGLALAEAMSELKLPTGEPIQVRIGVATGLVVLNDIHRLNNSSETFAVGGSIHLAARIQSISEVGKVLVDDTTHQLANRNFEFVDSGVHELKGFAQEEHLWEVGNPKSVISRFGERIEQSTPYVGRTEELQTLSGCWREAQHGQGQAILISGEPGIGKSRIVFEFVERVTPKQQPLVYQCLEDHENAPLHPWLNYMRHTAQFAPREAVEDRREKAIAVVGSVLPDEERLHSFVLNLLTQDTVDESSSDDDLDPAFKLELLREALVEKVFLLAKNEVQIVIVEDIHWIDPSSEGAWNSLVAEAAKHKVLLVATCHADKSAAFEGQQLTHIRLDKLGAQQSIALASQIMKTDQISGSLIAEIVERSDGVPLFVEELSRNIYESGYVRSTPGPARSSSKETNKIIPDTLQSTLLARLDRLGQSKKLIQMAAVIGRKFDVEVLATMTDETPEELVSHLKRLVEAGLIRLLSAQATTSYEFKHGLIRQTAYDSLLKRDAVQLHSKLAEIYEEFFPRLRSAEPETVAQHLTIAGRNLDAASVWLEAGQAARDMGSSEEALQRLDSCLECLEALEEVDETRSMRMRCEMVRGSAINSHFGPVEQSAHDAFAQAAALAQDVGDDDLAFEALIRLAVLKFNAGEFSGSVSVANRAIDYGTSTNNRRATTDGKVVLGLCAFAVGEFKKAQKLLGDASDLMLQDPCDTDAYTGLALGYLSLTEYILGNTEVAERQSAAAITRARNLAVSELASALGNSLYVHCMRGDIDMTRSVCEELVPISERMGFKMWYHHAQFFNGWASTVEGDRSGFKLMEQSMQRFRRAHELVEQSYLYYLMAERYLAESDFKHAHDCIELGLGLVKRIGERFAEVPLLRLKAKCYESSQQPGKSEEVAALVASAQKIAEEQSAVTWMA